MKKFFLILLFLFLILIAGLLYWFYDNTKSISSDKTFQNFLIANGTSASQIGVNLEKEGFIKNRLVFKIYLKLTNQGNKLQKGEFRLSSSMSMFDVISALQKGPIELWITIPEGLRREEIAVRFAESLGKDSTFITEFINLSKSKEGYLFPDTYLFPKEASAKTIIDRMINNFESKTSDLNLTYDQIILASMIERETKTNEERPIVAGIIQNRLRDDWPLQIDATNQYGVGTSKNWWPILSLDDIEKPSQYNTYKNLGFPPTPIANAGITSLRASANPVTSEYFFYIHDPGGVIHYAKTLSEHNANIRKYLGR